MTRSDQAFVLPILDKELAEWQKWEKQSPSPITRSAIRTLTRIIAEVNVEINRTPALEVR